MDAVTDFVIGVPGPTTWYWCGRKAKQTAWGWSQHLRKAKIYKSYQSAGSVITRYQKKEDFWKNARYQTKDEWKAEVA